ncbi:VaFE repeat-containing surface-anchored protein (plasmid) [Lactococcus petauri]|nr:VaFE repeat-containing surface-anchored protein [Lactococcus petauri]
MPTFKKKKLQKAIKEEKAKRLRMRKKQIASMGMLALTLSGTAVGLANADSLHLKLFNAPVKSIPLPDDGQVNYQFSGTGSAVWSKGETTAANFMQINGKTSFCIQPFVEVKEGATATREAQTAGTDETMSKMTAYQRNIVTNITYIGLVNNAEADKNINLATQVAIWMVQAGQNKVGTVLPTISELDTSKLNKTFGDVSMTDITSSGADIKEVVKYATTIVKQAIASSKSPDFNPNPLQVVAGSSATTTDKNGVLAGKAGGYGLPFDHISTSQGIKATRKDESLNVTADVSAIGKVGKIEVWNNRKDFNPSYIYGTLNPDGSIGQKLYAASDPANLEGELKVNVIGLGEAMLQKTSTNNAFSNKAMAGAEFTLFNADGKAVKWSDGQKGYPITPLAGTKANDTNVVLKMGTDGKLGVKNLDYTKEYYFQETKAPAGFALNAVKIKVSFDKNSKFDGTTNNYQDDVATKDIPTGATTLTKVDADTNSSETQGEATLKGVTYGLFHADGKAVEWSEGLTDKTEDSTENLPITATFGKKANDKTVELTVDDANKVGVQNLPLKENGQAFYWQELRTSSGYSQSSKKIPVVFDDKSEVDVATNDFIDEDKASDRVDVFNFMLEKVQEDNGSLPGINGAVFELKQQNGTKGKPIYATSGTGTDSNGYTKNGLVVFDGKANSLAGNPSKDGIAIGDYLLTEIKTPDGLKPINPIAISVTAKLDKNDVPVSYTATFKDTVTGQQIDKITVEASSLVNNNLMFKINLGMFTDKVKEQPKVTTTATDKADGDKTLGVGDAQIKDKVILSGLEADTEYTLESQPVSKETGKAIKDKDGKSSLVTQKVKTDKDGNCTVDVTSKALDTTGLQEKELTLLTKVKDKDGKVVVEDNNYKNNPTETVKVDKADGHTKVQDKEITVGTTTVTDKFFYEGLVKGNTYTVKITQAYDHDLKKVIDVDGSLTFKAKDTKGTVDVPVKVDSYKYKGHTLTFYEQTYPGDKPSDNVKPIIDNKDKNNPDETFKVKVPETPTTPSKETPSTPLADTGAALGQHLWGIILAGLALVAGGVTFFMKKRKSSSEK